MPTFIAFDLDGTLINSKQDIVDAVNFALAAERLPTLPASQIEDLVGRGARLLIQQAIGNPPDELLNQVFVHFWNRYLDHCLDATTLYPGVIEFLDQLSAIPMAIVTNKPEMFTRKILQGLGIQSRFRWIIGGDTLPMQKPDPQVFSPIFDSIGANRDGVMVGDSGLDIECARAAGLIACAISGGFRPKEELKEAKPDYLVDNFYALLDLPIWDAFRPPIQEVSK